MATNYNIGKIIDLEERKKKSKILSQKRKQREAEGLKSGELVSVDVSHLYNGIHTIKIMKKEKAIKLGLYEETKTNANKHP